MTIKLFKNTGYNSIDIPDSPETLQELFNPFKIYNNINVIQSDWITEIVVDGFNIKQARQVDYCLIEDGDVLTCYTIQRYEFLGGDTCRFYLLLDPYNSIGGLLPNSGNQIIAGSAQRMSVSINDDNNNFYTLEEPFQPSEKIVYKFGDFGYESGEYRSEGLRRFLEVITIPSKLIIKNSNEPSSVDPSEPYYKKDMMRTAGVYSVIKGGAETDSVVVGSQQPESRHLVSTTLRIALFVAPPGDFIDLKLGTRWFENDDIVNTNYNKTLQGGGTVKGDLIKDFRDDGRENDIVNYWEVPKLYIETIEGGNYDPTSDDAYGGITKIMNSLRERSVTYTPPTKVYNNKAKYSQSVKINVFCPANTQQIEKNIFDILNPIIKPSSNSFKISGLITADLRPSGNPIFFWRYVNGAEQNLNLYEIIKGASWRSIPLSSQGMSQKMYDLQMQDIKQSNREAKEKVALGALGAVAQVGMGIGMIATGAGAPAGAGLITSGVVGGLQTINSYSKMSDRQQNQQDLLKMQAIGASATIVTGNSDFARDINLNWFFNVIAMYSQNDFESYDTFLTRYGYNVGNKTFTSSSLKSRPAFNYIKINDITIKTESGNIELIEKVKNQMQAGVRLWHVRPDASEMRRDGNR